MSKVKFDFKKNESHYSLEITPQDETNQESQRRSQQAYRYFLKRLAELGLAASDFITFQGTETHAKFLLSRKANKKHRNRFFALLEETKTPEFIVQARKLPPVIVSGGATRQAAEQSSTTATNANREKNPSSTSAQAQPRTAEEEQGSDEEHYFSADEDEFETEEGMPELEPIPIEDELEEVWEDALAEDEPQALEENAPATPGSAAESTKPVSPVTPAFAASNPSSPTSPTLASGSRSAISAHSDVRGEVQPRAPGAASASRLKEAIKSYFLQQNRLNEETRFRFTVDTETSLQVIDAAKPRDVNNNVTPLLTVGPTKDNKTSVNLHEGEPNAWVGLLTAMQDAGENICTFSLGAGDDINARALAVFQAILFVYSNMRDCDILFEFKDEQTRNAMFEVLSNEIETIPDPLEGGDPYASDRIEQLRAFFGVVKMDGDILKIRDVERRLSMYTGNVNLFNDNVSSTFGLPGLRKT